MIRDHRACVLLGSGACSRVIKAPERGDLLEWTGDFWGFLRLVTAGKEGKVRSVSAEGVSYRARDEKSAGKQRLLRGE